MRHKHIICTLLVALLAVAGAQAQSLKELQAQQKKYAEEIENTGKMIKQTKQNEKATENKINLINQDIRTRKKLINSINQELVELDKEQNRLQNEHTRLESELDSLKRDYANLVQLTHYADLQQSPLLFLLSAKDFNQLVRRLRYMREFAAYRQQQVERIENVKADIQIQSDLIQDNRKEKDNALKTQQRERDQEAGVLLSSIDIHHRAIITACDGVGIKDKVKLKELKDLYYSYLMVYNKYDLSMSHATKESLAQLDELNSFQNDLLENVLGANSLPSQIENFKNVLKIRCDRENSDVYRSYSRVFRQTSVPISFANVSEYGDYINRLQTIINVQNRYLQTLELRAAINAGSDRIVQLYGKKYREVVNSYKDVARSMNMVPDFTTNAESINFIQHLEEFIAAQQRYEENYTVLEDISIRSDSILNGHDSKFRDITMAYREVQSTLVPVPTFKTLGEAAHYEEQLAEVIRVQQCYLQAIRLRHVSEKNDDSLMSVRKVDRTVYNGYRLFRKQADLQPNFSTFERGESFLSMLDAHIELQQFCLATVQKRRQITANDDKIDNKASSFRNIVYDTVIRLKPNGALIIRESYLAFHFMKDRSAFRDRIIHGCDIQRICRV